MKVKKVIIPAAGLGTRFLPATKAMPKELLPIVDKATQKHEDLHNNLLIYLEDIFNKEILMSNG